MNKIVKILIFFTISNSLFSQVVDYNPAVYYNKNSFFVESTNHPDNRLLHSVDLRYINSLYKEGKTDKADSALNDYIQLENDLGFKDKFKIFSYIRNERELLENSEIKWTFDGIGTLHKKLEDSINSKEYDSDIFPYSVIRGGLYYYHSDTLSNEKAMGFLAKELEGKSVKLDEAIPAKNGYVIPLINTNNGNIEFAFYAFQINNSIFNQLNGKYEISAIFYPGGEVTPKKYSEWNGVSEGKELIYGIKDSAGLFEKNDKIISLIDNLRLRRKPVIDSNNITGVLKKGDEVEIIDIGSYEVINEVGANWLKVKTLDNLTAWCFGSNLYLYYPYEEWSEDFT
ncbi:MAG: SH3 domain-containing protein [Deltaproteobacteria bacterium]|nr:SH3 domain-containing protein [Deltaproteobacteria bacterium]